MLNDYLKTQKENGFLSDIYMMLHSYKSGKNPKNFRFLHFDDPLFGTISQSFFESEENTRERLVSKGTLAAYDTQLSEALGVGRSALFLAKYLFGNLSAPGCSPLALMLNNYNWGKELLSETGEKLLTVKEIFRMFGYLDVYKECEQELLRLQEKYQNLSPYGQLIQIAIPKENLSKWVYHSKLGHHAQKEKFVLSNGKITDDMDIISEDVNKNPKRNFECVLVMARGKGGPFDPESGMEMFTYDLVEPEKMAEFKEEEKQLFDRILKSLKEKDMKDIQESKAALARE